MNSLEFAIKMEEDGAKYYMEQAELHEGNGMCVVCAKLAEEEKKHASLLKARLEGKAYQLDDRDTFTEIMNVFESAVDVRILGKLIPSQVDFYRAGLEFEKKSIDLYTEFLKNAQSDDEKELFRFLINQEKLHFSILDEIDRMLTNAEEWVENAEFGLREEY
ncbi:ferritin-like domain-containing protein [Parasporobacterium paucivorans]|uniref:Rubrerythrin n=1 Tax=Parasporobacterium paucivorans DSM 15970 TaxID=1122934 RepID=A0A1M6GG44_9FIRM|nr:ferritin family protein [Parasporobacterium paucivorans]SHJ08925.1 Rubrerythrin [Parasporobacterium paucivorans DSM 15970]